MTHRFKIYFFLSFLLLALQTRNTCFAAGIINVSIQLNGTTVIPGPTKNVQVCKGAIFNLLMKNDTPVGTQPPGTVIYEWKNLDSLKTFGANQINTGDAGRWVATIKYYNTSTATYTTASDTIYVSFFTSAGFGITTTTGVPINAANMYVCGTKDSTILASPGYSDYKWYKNSTANQVGSTNSLTITNALLNSTEASVSFFVTAKNASGCEVSTQKNIRRDNSFAVDLGTDQVKCSGTPVTLSSPTSPPPSVLFAYKWSTGATNVATINVNTTGTYTLSITSNGSKCILSSTVKISYITPPTVVISKDTSICFGTSVQLNASIANPGPGSYSYSWLPSAGLSNPSINNPVASPATAGPNVYTVTITDPLGCSGGSSKSTTITVFPKYSNPYFTLNAGNDTIICYGKPSELNAKITSSTYPSTYTWEWGPGPGFDNNAIPNPQLMSTITGTKTYGVTATDTRGCKKTDSLLIQTLPELIVTTSFTDTTQCVGATVQLYAYASGGSSAVYGFDFSPPSGTISSNQFTYLQQNEGSEIISVTAIDAKGCRSSKVDVTITGYRPFIQIASAKDTVVLGDAPLILVANTKGKPNLKIDWYEQFSSAFLISGPTYTSYDDETVFAFCKDTIMNCTNADTVTIDHVEANVHVIYIPTVFSPEASNVENQQLKVYGTLIQEDSFSFRIYNQWGQLVYQTNSFIEANTKGWSGEIKSNSGKQSSNVYTYTVEGKFFDGLDFSQAGTTTLLR